MFANGKPRYWIPSYDRWNLLFPAAFLAVLAWMCTFPATPANFGAVRPEPPPPLSPTSVESPASNSHFRASRIGDVEGRAQPGTLAVLYYAPAQSAMRELGRMEVGIDGRYRFHLAGFAPGLYTLKVAAWAADGRSAESKDVFLWVEADPQPAPKPTPIKRRKTR